jgi:hypothetical protein
MHRLGDRIRLRHEDGVTRCHLGNRRSDPLGDGCSMTWSNVLPSVAITAQLGLVRHAAFSTVAARWQGSCS